MSGATQVGLSMEEVGGRPGRAAGQLGNQSAGSSGARRLGPRRAGGVRQRRLSSSPRSLVTGVSQAQSLDVSWASFVKGRCQKQVWMGPESWRNQGKGTGGHGDVAAGRCGRDSAHSIAGLAQACLKLSKGDRR